MNKTGLEMIHFYPRPPRGGRRYIEVVHPKYLPISIPALREEGDALDM